MPELFGRGGKVSILLLVYLQRLSCADIVASQTIPATQLADTDTITLCDSTQRVTILYLVVDGLAIASYGFGSIATGHGYGTAIFEQLGLAVVVDGVLVVYKGADSFGGKS